MKKVLSIILVATAFVLVGCTAEKSPATSTVTGTGFSKHKTPCKGRVCGKLGGMDNRK